MAIDKATIEVRAQVMRWLTDEERAAAIAASPNVIGFDRFAAVAKQVELSHAYRSPTKR